MDYLTWCLKLSLKRKMFYPWYKNHWLYLPCFWNNKYFWQKMFGGHLVIKVDVRRVFDIIYWSFLLKVLRNLVTTINSSYWSRLLFILLSCPFTSMASNMAIFSFTKGARQGDHFCPLLFCLFKRFSVGASSSFHEE